MRLTRDRYEKRRTLLLSQFYGHGDLDALSSAGHSRAASLAGISAGPYATDDSFSNAPTAVERTASQFQGRSTPASTYGSDYAFNPDPQYNHLLARQSHQQSSPDVQSRLSTMLDSQQGFFDDFAGQQIQDQSREESYGGPQRYSTGEAFSPTANIPPPLMPSNDMESTAPIHQLPLEPREVPFAVYDPHNKTVPMSNFDNIGAVLRHRARSNGRQPAYWVLDSKGKETASITWEKLASRAEKVAQVIRDKSNLYRGDRVALVYRDTEVIEFAVALMGCFIAGVVAVPINNVDDYQKLGLLLTTTLECLVLLQRVQIYKIDVG